MTKLLHLEGIHGIAICSVIGFHFFPDYFPNGYLGVDLFFVLSGYLMSMMLSRHSHLTISIVAEFLYRRIKRIIPLYYLVILITTAIIYFCPCSEIVTNMASSKRAISFTTNLYFDNGDDYFEKLGVAHDLFTHTWSLCLELQFYLLFPFLWWIQVKLSPTRRMLLLHVISNMVFCLEQHSSKSEVVEKIPLLDETEKGGEVADNSTDWIFASVSLLLLAYSTITEQHLTANYARMSTTVVSIILIYFGKDFYVLENAVMAFLGKISYAWYLIHWPILTLSKVFGYTSTLDVYLGIVLSLSVAIAVHHTVERRYLSWEKIPVFSTVTILVLVCFCLYYGLNDTHEACVRKVVLQKHYANMTIEERKKYNSDLSDNDRIQLVDDRCIFEQPRTFGGSEGTCKYANPKSNNSRIIAIIGNSWAANSSPLVFEECSPYFGQIYRSAGVGCEVFKTPNNEIYCPKRQQMYYDMVERVKPEYLFIIVRYHYMMEIFTEAEWNSTIQDGIERLSIFSEHVQKKIFILHTFPYVRIHPAQLAEAMDKRAPLTPNDWSYKQKPTDMQKAQEKLDKIVRNCSKCEQYDYTSQFMIDGVLQPYEPQYFIAYLTYGIHFTPPALELIRPIYTDICKRINAE